MKKILRSGLLAGLMFIGGLANSTDSPEAVATLTRVGQESPAIEATMLDGQKFNLKNLRGKVVMVNFFATWCGPCMSEMPRLETEVWQKFKGRNFAMVAIGREHSAAELVEFQKQHKFTFPLAPDPKREIYAKFATSFIPRTYIIDAEGKIAFQSEGYTESDFGKMVAELQKEIAKSGPKG